MRRRLAGRQAGIGLVVLATAASVAPGAHAAELSYAPPKNCSLITAQNQGNPYAPLFRELCERTDARLRQDMARLQGRPQPSTKVLRVPAHGSPEARRYGVACIGGLVMLRIDHGWEQALDREHRYYTCRSD